MSTEPTLKRQIQLASRAIEINRVEAESRMAKELTRIMADFTRHTGLVITAIDCSVATHSYGGTPDASLLLGVKIQWKPTF